MVATGKMSLAVHEFALYDQLFSNGEAFLCRAERAMRAANTCSSPAVRRGPSRRRRCTGLMPICARGLTAAWGILLGCCGVISNWAGREELFDETCAQLRSELERLGSPTIIAACPTCQKTLREAGLGECTGIWTCCRARSARGRAHGLRRGGHTRRLRREGRRGDAKRGARAGVEARLQDNGARPHAGPLRLLRLRRSRGLCQARGRGRLHQGRARRLRGIAAHLLHGLPRPLRAQGAESAHILELIYSAPAGSPRACRKAAQQADAQAADAARHLEGGHTHGPERLQNRVHP